MAPFPQVLTFHGRFSLHEWHNLLGDSLDDSQSLLLGFPPDPRIFLSPAESDDLHIRRLTKAEAFCIFSFSSWSQISSVIYFMTCFMNPPQWVVCRANHPATMQNNPHLVGGEENE